MARVTAGPAPWSHGYRALRKDTTQRAYIPGRGYRRADSNWQEMPKHTATKTIRNPLTGRNMKVPLQDLDDYINMMNSGNPDNQVYLYAAEHGLGIEEGMAAYAEEAFDKHHKSYRIEGCGHVRLLEYNVRRQVMRVTFATDGAVVVYFRIPQSLFGELYHLAASKSETRNTFDGSVRHVLGVRFWDLVRVRGSKHGSRYRFTYVTDGSYVPTGNLRGRPKGSGKYTYEKIWNADLGKEVKFAVTKDYASDTERMQMEAYQLQDSLADKLDRVYDYDTTNLEYFFDDYFGEYKAKANAAQSKLLNEAKDAFDSGNVSDDKIIGILRKTGMVFPEASKLGG